MSIQTDIQPLEGIIQDLNIMIDSAKGLDSDKSLQPRTFDTLGNTPAWAALSELFDYASVAQEEYVAKLQRVRTRLEEVVKRLNQV